MPININSYVQFLNVIDNQATVNMTNNSYIKELKECKNSESRACCTQQRTISKNCNHKLYAILDEAVTNDHDLKSQIKRAFDNHEIIFSLDGKDITL
jgi:hypothetical protein